MLVADTDTERHQGLREVSDLGVYDGMLFVFPEDVGSRFTMANTLMPLDIDWYTVDGTHVSSEEMTPCPEGRRRLPGLRSYCALPLRARDPVGWWRRRWHPRRLQLAGAGVALQESVSASV